MDIDFFHPDGPHGIRTDTWTNQYEYVTRSDEGLFEHIVQAHGLLYGAPDKAAAHTLAISMWRLAQAKMPPNYSDALRNGPMSTALPPGTKVWLTLPPLPPGHAWGRATLAGTTINAAWAELSKYLPAGAGELAHANGRELLDHIINTQLRADNGVTQVTQATLGKSLTGDLYFRVRFHAADTTLPIAADATGRTNIPSWIAKYNQTILQLYGALHSFQHALAMMGEDMMRLAALSRVNRALFDIGNLVVIRKGDWFGDYNPLVHDVSYCQREVILPSLPGGSFNFPWSLKDAPITKAVLGQRSDAAAEYKLLRDAYKKYPAIYVSLVNDICAVESDILAAMVVDGDVGDAIHPEVKAATEWLSTATSGDAPDSAGGLGVLLGMLLVDLPDDLAPPANLINLSLRAMLYDGLLTAPDDPLRSALETRLKGALATTLALPSDIRAKLKAPTGWDDVQAFFDGAKKASYMSKEAIRVAQMPGAVTSKDYPIGKLLRTANRMKKVKWDKLGLKDSLAVIRAISFVATAVGLVNDALKLGSSLTGNGGDPGEAVTKALKDTTSAFGSFARDYYATRAQLGRMTGTLTSQDEEALKLLEKRWKPTGNMLGVVSGVWTLSSGLSERNPTLTAAGLFNAIGYGIRKLSWDEGLAAVVGFDVTVPLLLIGAGLDLLNALGPAKADALMRKQAMNMLKGSVQTLRNWYEQHPQWRPDKNPDFEEMLANVEGQVNDVDDEDVWKPMRPFSDADAELSRARLVEIGFSSTEAEKLVPTEWTYVLSGSPPTALDPKYWPPNWPSFDP